jgi:hypothetical protein
MRQREPGVRWTRRNRAPKHRASPSEGLWTGTLGWDVTSSGGSRIGCLEMEFTTDRVLLRFQQRPLGDVSRATLRGWLTGRRGVLQCGHVRLERGGRNVYAYLGLAPPDLMPHDMAEQLEALV